jgi:hypothetical protein
MRERVHQHDLGKGGGIAFEFFVCLDVFVDKGSSIASWRGSSVMVVLSWYEQVPHSISLHLLCENMPHHTPASPFGSV